MKVELFTFALSDLENGKTFEIPMGAKILFTAMENTLGSAKIKLLVATPLAGE